ncbi:MULTISPECIES: GMC oxidoreductase [unclassified Pseudoclavibacter]|uniref:GMC oxidoreductase n=1 Tax=unclassified Pseudoclavibacter TaxID=2615177 RepID=UPI001BAA57A9|nr:GMC oxidoreductase [Pseudoclavibacter sp. Marseille-Q4354]MBS3178756.1 GMC family oxidoreductase N-terminal domain-containing protein [Pseudoclavibacter sp. Marseille-Q4354]
MSRYPERVDVAIVGSGPAGATYARILSETAPELRIAMFEVGPTVSNPPGAHVKNIEDLEARSAAQRRSEGTGEAASKLNSPVALAQGKRQSRPGTYILPDGDFSVDGGDGMPVAAMSSNVGGMSAHWTGACPRPGESERIAFLDGTGELDELLDEADRLLGVTTDAFDDAPFTQLIRDRLSPAVDEGREPAARVQRMPLAVRRREDGRLVWSGSDVVLGDVTRQNPNYSLFDESLVTRTVIGDDGAVAGVEVRDLSEAGDSQLSFVGARVVIIAADALRTPQVLWASGIRPDALGRYLNDQTQIVFAARITGLEASADQIADAAQRPAGTITETSGVSWIPYTDDQPFHGQVMQLDASPVPIADDDAVIPGSIVGLGLFCAKDLQRDDRVLFEDGHLDSYGMPAVRIHYTATDHDREVMEAAKQRLLTLGRAIGEPLDDRAMVLPFGASLHYQGTTRMGETDDGESVCSPTSEVWGVPGLYVAGNGVIPTSTACNPTLTGVALAVKGARDVAAKLAGVAAVAAQATRN